MKNLMRMSFLLLLSIALVNCSKDETPTITDLDFTVTTGDIARDVIVDPSATGAENFNIYFDFSNDPNSFETSTGDAVTYTYPASNADYTIKVVATNSNGAEDVELTKSHNVTLPPLVLTLTAPTGATEAEITGPWWGWSQDGPVGVSNGDDTFTFTFDPAPTENMEYLYIVDGNYEDLIDNAVNAECAARVDAGRMNTDYSGYANRIWIIDSGNFSEVYSQCD